MEWPRDFPEDHAFVELLVPGVSSDVDFETFLKVTEKKLSLNATSIEQQLKELQSDLGDSRMGDRPPSPIECLQWFKMQSCLRRGPKHQELMDFFKALHQYLKSEEEAKEEVTLHLIMRLSASCGVSFPCIPSSSSSSSPLHPQMTASSHLLHTVTDDTSLELQEAWDMVRLQLRRYLMNRLSPHNPDHPELRPKSTLSIDERVHCLQQLFFLYPETEVLKQYQGLKCQHVLDILHSSLCSSLGGETGFDRLAIGLSNVIPLLIQAITEELQVLSRLAEPHTILGFLNTAYLGAVVQELTTLMEREREMAQRDHTALSSKFKKHSVKSRVTVAPVELPVTGRSFCLTSHQLRALTQLSFTLLRFEKEVKELATNMNFIDCTGDAAVLKGALKKSKMESDVTTDGKTSTTATSLHSTEAQVLEFNWRSAFQGLVPHMEHCVKVVLDDVCAKNLQQEEDSHSSGSTSVTLCPVTGPTDIASSNTQLKEDSFYNQSESETPRMIVKFCGAIMTELDALLPLAAACSDTSLLGVRVSFVAACGRAALAMLDRLQERALEIPSHAPLKNLPALLATCTYMHHRLQYYNTRLKGSKTTTPTIPLTLLPIQRCQDTVEAIREQLTSYCIQICATCIFQDAESHHWADPKPFYEGERCSFSVQMWFYFLCGLRSDLWAVLSPEVAKNVLGQVLSETLQLLVERYARARASFKRHLQIRCDITAVLLYVEQLLWSVCESPEALVHMNTSAATTLVAGGTDWPHKIHSLCDQLLTVLVIVTAPISLLHRTFMIDAAKDSSPQKPEKPLVHWLNAINPDLFTEQGIRDGLMGHTALACQLRLLTSDPGCNPKLLLRMLLHRDCHLPRLLLENSHFVQENSLIVSPENCKAGDDFMVALFNLLSSLNGVPKALTMALQPYLERVHIWEHLYRLADTTHPVPVVIRCVRAIVAKRTDSLLLHLISMVQGWQTTEEPSKVSVKHSVPECVLAKIPKEWNYIHLDARGKDSVSKTGISLSIQALSFIFTNLPLAVASMPLPIRFLFQEGEKHLSQHVRQLRLVGLLLWAFLSCLIQSLEDPHTRENISGLTLDRWAKERLSLLAECLQGAIGIQQKGIPKPTVHQVLQALEENRPKWINMQLQKARKLCSDR